MSICFCFIISYVHSISVFGSIFLIWTTSTIISYCKIEYFLQIHISMWSFLMLLSGSNMTSDGI